MNKKQNNFRLDGDVAIVSFTNAKAVFICDAADWEKARKHAWSLSKTGYPVAGICGRPVLFHRFLFPDAEGDIDHIDGDKLRNTRANLRLTTHQQNTFNTKLSAANTSGIKGVCWHKSAQKWMASIRVNGKCIYLGLFSDIEKAKNARKEAEKKYFGQYARAV